MKPPVIVNATQAELDELLAKARPTFTPEQYHLLEGVLGTFIHVMQALQNTRTSLKRFRKMLFGARTESKANVLGNLGADADVVATDTASDATGAAVVAATTSTDTSHDDPPSKAKPAKPGHGRNGAEAYRNAPVVEVALPDSLAGQACPDCDTGRVYAWPPRTIVKVTGQPPLGATVYKLQQLRCRICDALFTAPMPEGLGETPKYDESCASVLAVLRYGSGMPFFRLESLQDSLGIPLPDATQWDIVVRAVPGPQAAFEELTRQAAQAELLHNDDTPARILSLINERTRIEAAGKEPESKAINTSGIVAVLRTPERELKVVLFFTGHAHAGNNLAKVLAQRAEQLGPPMQMCDALSSNIPGEFATVLCNCLAHGRRLFVDLIDNFPRECRHVIEVLAKVYVNDAHCHDAGMSPEQRLASHQAHSGPPMRELKNWMGEQLEQRLVEPNSSLGGALNYMLKRWDALTLFLRKAGAPLDNNIAERALKRAIRHRRNSLFYKTLKGAAVGDVYMSIIHTCELCDVNPFEYLQALQLHAQDVIARPALWLPWNYHEQLLPRLALAA
ncbi:MAG: IS66 family transposase [Burkholderiales bacterium]|nr:IS66 family transposase [Burkholderiales bacterium]